MNKQKVLDRGFRFFGIFIGIIMFTGLWAPFCSSAPSVYSGDSIRIRIKGLDPTGQVKRRFMDCFS